MSSPLSGLQQIPLSVSDVYVSMCHGLLLLWTYHIYDVISQSRVLLVMLTRVSAKDLNAEKEAAKRLADRVGGENGTVS